MTPRQLRDLQGAEIDPELYSPAEVAALEFAEAMARDATAVPDEAVRRLREHFSEGEVVEIAMVAGLFLYFNAFNNALATPPTAPSPYVL